MQTLPELLQTMVQMEGSDLHITTNMPPQVRVHGHLTRLEGAVLSPSDTKQLSYSVLTGGRERDEVARDVPAVDAQRADAARDTGRIRDAYLVDRATKAPGDAERLP